MTPIPLVAFGLGLAGSTHCVAMCGGFAGLARPAAKRGLPVVADAPRTGLLLALQHTGRLASYAAAGALAGGAGRWAMASWQVGLELFAGVTMIGVGLFLCGLLPGFARVEALGAPLLGAIRPAAARLLRLRTPLSALALGGAWGWLPCGLVYSVLPLSLASGGAAGGAAVMLAFGAGTVPALLAVPLVLGFLQRVAGSAKLKIAGGAVIAFMGALHLTLAASKLHDPHAACHAATSVLAPE